MRRLVKYHEHIPHKDATIVDSGLAVYFRNTLPPYRIESFLPHLLQLRPSPSHFVSICFKRSSSGRRGSSCQLASVVRHSRLLRAINPCPTPPAFSLHPASRRYRSAGRAPPCATAAVLAATYAPAFIPQQSTPSTWYLQISVCLYGKVRLG